MISAGRSGPHITRPDWRRRVDDDRRQPVSFRHCFDKAFGRDLAALVGANRPAFGQTLFLGRRSALDRPEGRNATGVNNPLDARSQRLFHQEPRALDVILDDLFGVSSPETVIGGRMEEQADAFQRVRERSAISEVALE